MNAQKVAFLDVKAWFFIIAANANNRKTLIMNHLTVHKIRAFFPPSINSLEKMPVF